MAAAGLKVKTTIAVADNPGGFPLAVSDYTPLTAAVPVKCSKPCFVAMHVTARVATGVNATNWAICVQSDGSTAGEPPCPYFPMLAALNFDVRSFDQLLALPRGTHMLVPTIYVDAAAVTLTSYSFTFTVYAK